MISRTSSSSLLSSEFIDRGVLDRGGIEWSYHRGDRGAIGVPSSPYIIGVGETSRCIGFPSRSNSLGDKLLRAFPGCCESSPGSGMVGMTGGSECPQDDCPSGASCRVTVFHPCPVLAVMVLSPSTMVVLAALSKSPGIRRCDGSSCWGTSFVFASAVISTDGDLLVSICGVRKGCRRSLAGFLLDPSRPRLVSLLCDILV
jgi:hypothetical protein